MPLVMEGRRAAQPIAATYIERGLDLDRGPDQGIAAAVADSGCFPVGVWHVSAGTQSTADGVDELRDWQLEMRGPWGVARCRLFLCFSVLVVQGHLTSFHLPKSSLLLLVSALIGRNRLLELYEIAIQEAYRFYSFGDAIWIAPDAVLPVLTP